jgi:hypothetical protein
MRGEETLQAWLLLLMPGRYRLLSDEQVQGNSLLEPVRLLILEGKSVAVLNATYADEPSRAAIVARLAPTAVSPPKPGWRIAFPKTFEIFVPQGCDPHSFSVVFSLEGYCEIWYTDVLRKIGTAPLPASQSVG